MANERCKEYLKYYRKVLKAKKEEKIDKRYKPYLAPNNKYYEGHCGHCAEVQYLTEIYSKADHQKIDEEYIKISLGINREFINEEFPCQSLAAEERARAQDRYKPNPESFNAFIRYLKDNPGKKLTYEDYKKYKEGGKRT